MSTYFPAVKKHRNGDFREIKTRSFQDSQIAEIGNSFDHQALYRQRVCTEWTESKLMVQIRELSFSLPIIKVFRLLGLVSDHRLPTEYLLNEESLVMEVKSTWIKRSINRWSTKEICSFPIQTLYSIQNPLVRINGINLGELIGRFVFSVKSIND